MTVDKGAVCRLVLNHDIAVLIDVDAEVDIADALEGIVCKDDVASRRVTAKGEAEGMVLDRRGQAQEDGVVAMAGGVGFEAAGMVLEFVVGLYAIGLLLSYDEGRVLESQALDLLAGRVGVGVEDAEDVGDVIVGEARVLPVFTSRVEDGLGRCVEQVSKSALEEGRSCEPWVASSPSIGSDPLWERRANTAGCCPFWPLGFTSHGDRGLKLQAQGDNVTR